MYVVEGELIVRKSPESFLGQFGVFHESVEYGLGGTATNTEWATGNERIVNFVANRMRKKGRIPVETSVEKITSLEQAQKFAIPSSVSVRENRFRLPDLTELLMDEVPEDAELLEGAAQLWKDRRIPTPYIYFAALGKLLADVEYDPTRGWHDRYEHPYSSEGTRTTKGILTPVVRLYSTRTDTSAYKSYTKATGPN